MNITLPAKTATKLKKTVKARERSRVIAEALELYFQREARVNLLKDLTEAYTARSEEGLADAELWDSTLKDGLDDETR